RSAGDAERCALLDHADPALGRQGDRPQLPFGQIAVRRPKLRPGEDPLEHDPHLGLREARAETAPGAAAERDPGVGVWWVGPKEPLGPEHRRARVQVPAAVHGPDRGVDLDPDRHLVAVEAERRLANATPDGGDHGADSQRLLDDRVEVALIALLRDLERALIV